MSNLKLLIAALQAHIAHNDLADHFGGFQAPTIRTTAAISHHESAAHSAPDASPISHVLSHFKYSRSGSENSRPEMMENDDRVTNSDRVFGG